MTTATRLTSRDSYIPLPTAMTSHRGVDLIAVERAVNGELPEGINDKELAHAARVLSEHNVSRDEASRRLLLPDYIIRRCEDTGWDTEAISAWRERSKKRAAAA